MPVSFEVVVVVTGVAACVALGAILAVWNVRYGCKYDRLGYPTIPPYLRISTLASLEDVRTSLRAALKDGFEIARDTDTEIVVVKKLTSPMATITARFCREGIWADNELEVRCHEHEELTWRESSRNSWFGLASWMQGRRK